MIYTKKWLIEQGIKEEKITVINQPCVRYDIETGKVLNNNVLNGGVICNVMTYSDGPFTIPSLKHNINNSYGILLYEYETLRFCYKPTKEIINMTKEAINHPSHYGGENNPYEAIKVIEAWDLNFNTGNSVKYIARAGKKNPEKHLEDLKKAQWYLEREIDKLENND